MPFEPRLSGKKLDQPGDEPEPDMDLKDTMLKNFNNDINFSKPKAVIPVIINYDEYNNVEDLYSEYNETGYMKNFYIEDNITGFTGDVNNLPTVYFKKYIDKMFKFGSITQDHDVKDNIGRASVQTASDYLIKNTSSKGVDVGVECAVGILWNPDLGYEKSENPFGYMYHECRGIYNEVGGNREILALAIEKFKNKKNLIPQFTIL